MPNWRVLQKNVFGRTAEQVNHSLDTQYFPGNYEFHES